MHLGVRILKTSDVMIVAPPSLDRASMFSVNFPDAISDYDILMDTVIDANGVTLPDACIDEMDMIGVGRILDATPHRLHSASDMFGVFMLEKDDDDSVTIITPDVITIEGASDSVDPPLSFDTMSGFVTRFDHVAGGNNNDMSVFEYSPVSLHFPFIISPTPTPYTHDVNDVRGPNDPLSDQSNLDSDSEERKVTPVSGSIELVDFRPLINPGS